MIDAIGKWWNDVYTAIFPANDMLDRQFEIELKKLIDLCFEKNTNCIHTDQTINGDGEVMISYEWGAHHSHLWHTNIDAWDKFVDKFKAESTSALTELVSYYSLTRKYSSGKVSVEMIQKAERVMFIIMLD